VLALAQK
jgi:hypothetical protein